MAPSNEVTLRDVMDLQRDMYQKLDAIKSEITNIKIKVAIISGTVSTIISVGYQILQAMSK